MGSANPTEEPAQATPDGTSASGPATGAPGATATPGLPTPAAGEGLPSWLLVVLVLVVVFAALGFWIGGRRRREKA